MVPVMTSILITGASSGIGAALAQAYAARGGTLALSGRDEARLQETVASCGNAAAVSGSVVDVGNQAAMRAWIEAMDDKTPLDLVIANAGISGGGTEAADRRIFEINIMGVLNTVHPALDRMVRRGRGQIALVSSIAGSRGMPSAPAYSASKAAVLAYGEALRGRYLGSGLSISVICPGFVRSRITDQNDFPMPFFMEADRAAQIILKGLDQGAAKITFPWQMRLAGWLLRACPSGVGTSLLSKLPEKSGN